VQWQCTRRVSSGPACRVVQVRHLKRLLSGRLADGVNHCSHFSGDVGSWSACKRAGACGRVAPVVGQAVALVGASRSGKSAPAIVAGADHAERPDVHRADATPSWTCGDRSSASASASW
jgi:hypothetical protein